MALDTLTLTLPAPVQQPEAAGGPPSGERDAGRKPILQLQQVIARDAPPHAGSPDARGICKRILKQQQHAASVLARPSHAPAKDRSVLFT